MEVLAGTLAYPVIEIAMRVVSAFGEIGLVAFLVLILVVSGALCVQPERALSTCIATLLAPFLGWFAMFVALGNSGVGNFIIELGALITVMLVACAIFRMILRIRGAWPSWAFYGPHFSLFLASIVLRLFMPLVGK